MYLLLWLARVWLYVGFLWQVVAILFGAILLYQDPSWGLALWAVVAVFLPPYLFHLAIRIVAWDMLGPNWRDKFLAWETERNRK